MTHYQSQIRAILARQGQIGRYDPRHVEAYLRLDHGALDSIVDFRSAALLACAGIDAEGAETAEQVARSMGL